MNKLAFSLALALVLVVPVSPVLAQKAHPPIDNVGKRHPNLKAAQHLCTKAYEKLVASQQANEFDEGGHAQKAKELLEQVNQQIKEAAEFDNARGRR
jgi:hypothetical protein